MRLVVGQLVDHPLTNDLGGPETINGAMSGYAAIPFHPMVEFSTIFPHFLMNLRHNLGIN